MIIKLTLAEIKGFVATSLNLNPSRFDIEIVNSADASLLTAFLQVVREFPAFLTYDKIPAMKKFRELAPKGADGYSSVGLADAKWAVENPTVTLANLEATGRIH